MPITTLGDIFGRDPVAAYDVVQSFMDVDPVTVTPFFESGLLVNDPRLQAEIERENGTGKVDLPYWLGIDASVEPNYSNDVYEDIAVPRAIGTGYMSARAAYLNEGWGSADLVREIRDRDPLARIASRLELYWREQAERRLVATLRGLLASATTNDYDMVVEAAAITDDALIDAQLTMGDNFGAIGGYVMNTAAFGALAKAGNTAVNRDPTTNLLIRTFNGLPVIVNDQAMTSTDGQPIIALIGGGTFGYAMTEPRMPLEYDRQPERANGGGVEVLWTRRDMLLHPLGWNFTSASITGNGTETRPASAGWTDLTNPANWELGDGVERKKVPLAFLVIDSTP